MSDYRAEVLAQGLIENNVLADHCLLVLLQPVQDQFSRALALVLHYCHLQHLVPEEVVLLAVLRDFWRHLPVGQDQALAALVRLKNWLT